MVCLDNRFGVLRDVLLSAGTVSEAAIYPRMVVENALRTVPVMMDIARDIEAHAPDAWLINFTNPSGIVTEALLNHTGVKTIGLCNIPITSVRRLAQAAGTESFDYDFVGLNHLSWITGLRVDGREVLQEKIAAGLEAFRPKNIKEKRYDARMLRAMGGIPCSYLDYYLFRDEKLREQQAAEQTRGEICAGLEKELLALYSDPTLDVKPAQLEQRGVALYSTAAISLIDDCKRQARGARGQRAQWRRAGLYGGGRRGRGEVRGGQKRRKPGARSRLRQPLCHWHGALCKGLRKAGRSGGPYRLHRYRAGSAGAQVYNCLVGSGSILNGKSRNSVLFRKVYTGEDSEIRDSIIMEGLITHCLKCYAIVCRITLIITFHT